MLMPYRRISLRACRVSLTHLILPRHSVTADRMPRSCTAHAPRHLEMHRDEPSATHAQLGRDLFRCLDGHPVDGVASPALRG